MYTTHHKGTGATRRLWRTAELLAKRDREVTVFCTKWWDDGAVEFEQGGVTYHRVADVPAIGDFASHIPFTLRKVSPDVIQVASYPPWHVTAVRIAAWFLRTPVVVDWRTRDDRGGSRACRRMAKSPNTVLAPSEMVRARVHELSAAIGSTHLVPEPVSMDLVRSADADECVDMVYVRDLDEHANVESFLLTLAGLRDKGWSAVVTGDGPECSTVEQTARDLHIDDRVELLDGLSANETVLTTKSARVFARTATVGPFATSLLQALVCGYVSVVEY